MTTEVKFAGTIIRAEQEVVAKVTSFARSLTISEEDVTGAEDVIAGSDVLSQDFAAIAVGETATIEGISMEDVEGADSGQSELKDAAEKGDVIEIEHVRNTGHGKKLTGFFTSYEETGSTTAVYRFRGTFRVKSTEDIVPTS